MLFGGLALLCLLGLALLLLVRSRPPVLTPPAEQARQDLAPLSRQPEDGKVLSRVSQVMRHYLAAAFGLPPGEFTTAEFCRALQDQAQVGPALSGSVTEFLRRCDERKFAPSPPAAPLGAVDQALQLLDQAEARRRELAAAAAPGATPAQ